MRLKLGFDGPLAELAEVPPCAESGCSLDCMGTGRVSLGLKEGPIGIFHGEDRVREVYGPPTRVEGDTLCYDWLYPPTPRRMRFRIEAGGVADMYLELAEVKGTGIRPLGPAEPFERMPQLPQELQAKLREGETHLREGRPAEAQRLFTEVQDALRSDDGFVHNINLEVAARQAMAQAAQGGVKAATERVEGLLKHLETYATYNPPEVLRMRFALGQVQRHGGHAKGALREFHKLWELLQVSQYYPEPEVQSLVRRTAAELELLGEPGYAEEIRRIDGV